MFHLENFKLFTELELKTETLTIKHRFIQKSKIKCSIFCGKLNSNVLPQSGKPKQQLAFSLKNFPQA